MEKRVRRERTKPNNAPLEDQNCPHFIVVGGGVAGISCAQELTRLHGDSKKVTLISSSKVIKETTTLLSLGSHLEKVAVYEKESESFGDENPLIKMILGNVKNINYTAKEVSYYPLASTGNVTLHYSIAVIVCAGADPKRLISSSYSSSSSSIRQSFLDQHVLYIRDTESIEILMKKLTKIVSRAARPAAVSCSADTAAVLTSVSPSAQIPLSSTSAHILASARPSSRIPKVAVVGNGGIALELIHEMRSTHGAMIMEVVWIVRDEYIGHAFFDASSSAFVTPSLFEGDMPHEFVSCNGSMSHSSAAQSDALTVDNDSTATEPTDSHPSGSNGGSTDAYRPFSPCLTGASVGPGWVNKYGFRKLLQQFSPHHSHPISETEEGTDVQENNSNITIELNQTIRCVRVPTSVHTSNEAGAGVYEWLNVQNNTTELYGTRTDNRNAAMSSMSEIIDTDHNYPVYLSTNTNKVIGCDVIISAIGAIPRQDISIASTSPVVSTAGAGSNDDDRAIATCFTVNRHMQTKFPYVFAAGDCCVVDMDDILGYYRSMYGDNNAKQETIHNWFQMRTWSQARNMGVYAAHCMASVSSELTVVDTMATTDPNGFSNVPQVSCEVGFAFELFTHITHLFDYKVVLLGRFNGQGLIDDNAVGSTQSRKRQDGGDPCGTSSNALEAYIQNTIFKAALPVSPQDETDGPFGGRGHMSSGAANLTDTTMNHEHGEIHQSDPDYKVWVRVIERQQYVKLVLYRNTIVGAILIGETSLEEVMENLILNKTNVSDVGIDLLYATDVDVEDYYD